MFLGFAEGWCDMMWWYLNLWFSSAMVPLYLLGIGCFSLHFPNHFQHIKTCVILPTRKLFIGRISCEKTQDTLSKSSIAPENRPGPKRKRIIFQPSFFRGHGDMLVFGEFHFCLRRVMCFLPNWGVTGSHFWHQLVYRDVVFSLSHEGYTAKTGWWFQLFVIFTPIWGNDPFWLIFFRWVETTN